LPVCRWQRENQRSTASRTRAKVAGLDRHAPAADLDLRRGVDRARRGHGQLDAAQRHLRVGHVLVDQEAGDGQRRGGGRAELAEAPRHGIVGRARPSVQVAVAPDPNDQRVGLGDAVGPVEYGSHGSRPMRRPSRVWKLGCWK